MAYEPRIAAALSGATERQLSYWRAARQDRRPVLVPEVSSVRPLLYSFRDVVALRTCGYLRQRVPLQRIRRALDTLKGWGETRHLSEYRLVAQGATSVVLIRPDDVVDLVDRPGHGVTVVLNDVLRPFQVGDLTIPDLERPRAALSIDPEVRSGHPVVAGTRVPYELVAGLIEDGIPPEDIRDFYPSVTATGARDAESFAQYVDSYPRLRARVA